MLAISQVDWWSGWTFIGTSNFFANAFWVDLLERVDPRQDPHHFSQQSRAYYRQRST